MVGSVSQSVVASTKMSLVVIKAALQVVV